MSSLGDGQSVPYDVFMSAKTRADVKHLHRQAVLGGTGQASVRAFRQILERLRKDPLTFGEPTYRLPALHLRVRQGVIWRLVVDYAVHKDRPLDFIRGFKVLS
jgi:hypothetical protein